MKAIIFKLSAIGAMVLSFALWMYGGARIGWYSQYYEVMEFDPVLEFSHPVKVEAFLPGIETLALGFVAFVVLLALSSFAEKRPIASSL